MSTILTTITAYWSRPEALRAFMRGLRGARRPFVDHLIVFLREQDVPPWFEEERGDFLQIVPVIGQVKNVKSIGHVHNWAFENACPGWGMKMDVDCIPHPDLFDAVKEFILYAQPRQWLNVGMFYADEDTTKTKLAPGNLPLHLTAFNKLVQTNHWMLGGSNFVCRTEDYFSFGGCDHRFAGYGWEDYQQLYGLEENLLQRNPIQGKIKFGESSVTHACRDFLSRAKAKESLAKNPAICLIHRWHPHVSKNPWELNENKRVLISSIQMINHRRAMTQVR